jgi:hypothetical protein
MVFTYTGDKDELMWRCNILCSKYDIDMRMNEWNRHALFLSWNGKNRYLHSSIIFNKHDVAKCVSFFYLKIGSIQVGIGNDNHTNNSKINIYLSHNIIRYAVPEILLGTKKGCYDIEIKSF